MDRLVQRVHAVPTAEGFEEILMPGEIEGRLEAERLQHGVPYGRVELEALQKEAAAAQLPPLAVSADHFGRSEEHTSELQSLMRISYAVFCLKKKNKKHTT